MKIIDLLNKIANGEEPPKKILFKNNIYEYTEEGYFDEENKDLLFDAYYTDGILNDEVEILETTITYKQDDKIEKLEIIQEKNCKNNWKWKLNGYNISTPQKIMGDKINEIIDRINEL